MFTLSMVLTACSLATPIEVSSGSSITSSNQDTSPAPVIQTRFITGIPSTPSPTLRPTQTPQPSTTPTTAIASTATPSQTASLTSTSIPSPTYAILRGTVLEQANCRYGPGAPYLYKYGLYSGNNLEIIGRNELGTWIVIQAIGGSNPCWVKASLLKFEGDVVSLAPASLPLPQSPYYGPVSGVSAVRNGDYVTISWNPIHLKAGDDSLQYPYLIEAWLCQDGQLLFSPIGSWETIVTVQDESGCLEPSHARVYGVEKHGYTAWVEAPWPAA
ncbi:MAG: hypothetical protein A2030_08400 [Chloroflexi bacterium RBG_19FT_COMBO_50_10]|nr:MAG: hypothetical protein A2Y53_04730 [Chloroflexi bacterium RBG_16_47_49]OGO65081.1 MAG: hypothetical protein A2030_08400 [Chloroflexi bacterium RBG_19FT_COMBO_50_10]